MAGAPSVHAAVLALAMAGVLGLTPATNGQSPTTAPVEPDATSQAGLEQRVEVEGAYAVTIAADWRHELEDFASDESDGGRVRRDSGFAPNLHLRNEVDREQCRIEYGPNDGATLESLLAEAQEQPEFELGYVDLPAAPALRMAWLGTYDGVDLELAGYVVVHGGTRVQIWCAGPAAPADNWLSIAKTFEFLPAEK